MIKMYMLGKPYYNKESVQRLTGCDRAGQEGCFISLVDIPHVSRSYAGRV